MHVVTLCTGNAARSVIAGAVLARLAPGVRVSTRGTHVIDGLPMSFRTRDAIVAIGGPVDGHRSRQLAATDLVDADVVLAMAHEHVAYVRRVHPEAAARTVTLKRLARDAIALPGPLPERLAALGLQGVELGEWEDVADPAGAEAPVFLTCAAEIDALLQTIVPMLGEAGVSPPGP